MPRLHTVQGFSSEFNATSKGSSKSHQRPSRDTHYFLSNSDRLGTSSNFSVYFKLLCAQRLYFPESNMTQTMNNLCSMHLQ